MFFKSYKYEIYPHGSVRIGTTVKPIGKDEFDLDVVLHLNSDWTLHSPLIIYKELKRRLEEHDGYRSKMELKNRCIRLNYSGDFHMDLLSGIQENLADEDKLKVPDREQKSWVSSNPRGYAKWFKSQANQIGESFLEKAFKAEKLPLDSFKHKKPLQRAVQLIKRYRDLFFQEESNYRTSSIVLTTIAGQFYKGEASIFETINGIMNRINESILASSQRIRVLNPVNTDEDFTDKWEGEPEYFDAFKRFIAHFHDEWQKLKSDNGIDNEQAVFKGLFGESIYDSATFKQFEATKPKVDVSNDPYSGLKKLAAPLTPHQKPWKC